MKDKQLDLTPGIYMVATPIGNLEDITLRAVRVLENVDWIAAEDTRQTKKLLDHFGIHKTLFSVHEHSSERKIQECVQRLERGEKGAYVSDAGTPGICDPGADLVNLAREKGIAVFPIPGASAIVTLLSCAGFSQSAFQFLGFFPREEKQQVIEKMKNEGGIFVFFEAPHRFLRTLECLRGLPNESYLVVGRELTKHFETVSAGKVEEIYLRLQNLEPRGEYVLALSVPVPKKQAEWSAEKVSDLFALLADLGGNQKLLTKLGTELGLAKNNSYDLALEVLKTRVR